MDGLFCWSILSKLSCRCCLLYASIKYLPYLKTILPLLFIVRLHHVPIFYENYPAIAVLALNAPKLYFSLSIGLNPDMMFFTGYSVSSRPEL